MKKKYKRRSFLKKAALGTAVAAASTTLAAPAIAADRIDVAIVTSWPISNKNQDLLINISFLLISC